MFNDADCGTESDKLNVISSVEIDDSFLTISPNPFTDKLRIVIEDEKFPNEVIISDILGRIVYSQSLGNSGNYIELDLGDLPNGSYFLKLIFGNEYIQEHLVKE